MKLGKGTALLRDALPPMVGCQPDSHPCGADLDSLA